MKIIVYVILILATAFFVILAIIPKISNLMDSGPEIKICKETGLRYERYTEDIQFLLEEIDISKSSDEDEKEIVEFYKEFADCFPDNDFDNYLENNMGEQGTFSFIFVMKEQKYYDETTLKIAQRYLIRFPASPRASDVRLYVDQAKSAI